ncbi:RNase H family protein [Rhynchospora pubera]|uniref:RNase H family protein n=1 Tax=Rhynchospora pubera TaxID=906938 RepID=A0AAV8F0B4_9POAL|nr:RNase H family protein [Rhynchospora pubera]
MRSSLYRLCAVCKQGLTNYADARTRSLNLSSLGPHVVSFSYFSSSYSSTSKRARSVKPRTVVDQQPLTALKGEAFYVVRKGDIVGVYKSLSECQAQVSASICDPSVGVYKGYSLLKETEDYLTAKGLKNAIYTINASDLKDDLFGDLVSCPFQQPDGLASSVKKPTERPPPLEESQDLTSCIIEFDGASKGNPGKAGAGAVVRSKDGRVIAKLCEGLGITTNNVAEYRALLLGLKYAFEKGCKNVQVQGDSILVVRTVNGQWKGRKEHVKELCEKIKDLEKKFGSFKIKFVKREFNADADAQANLGAGLPGKSVLKFQKFSRYLCDITACYQLVHQHCTASLNCGSNYG